MERRILLTECPDAKGLIAMITGACFRHQFNIIKNDQFVSECDSRFFMRTEIEGDFGEENGSSMVNEILASIPAGGRCRLDTGPAGISDAAAFNHNEIRFLAGHDPAKMVNQCSAS